MSMNLKEDEEKFLRKKISALVKEYVDKKFIKSDFEPYITNIPASGKVIGFEEIENMVQASLDGWLTTGRFNKKFESELANYIGVSNLITVNSGSSANLIAFSTLTSPKLGHRAIKKNDEVISVAAGFPTTINPIIQMGAIPVFVDVDLKTYNIDTNKIEEAISSKTKCIMLAHTLGNPFDLDKITKICKKYDLWLIEDCCDALGTRYNGKMVGTFGDLATLSFYPAHHITMGEGGAVFSNNADLITISESFRDWGRDCYCPTGEENTCGKRYTWKLGNLPEGYDHKYIYTHLGYNMKITDMQAACGLAQLKKLDEFIEVRRNNFSYLKKRLSTCSDFLTFASPTHKSIPSWFGFLMTIKENSGFIRRDLIEYLNQNQIGTRLLFSGNIIKQPYMLNCIYKISGDLQNTEIVMNNTFWVGVYPALNNQHLEFIAEKIEEFFGINF